MVVCVCCHDNDDDKRSVKVIEERYVRDKDPSKGQSSRKRRINLLKTLRQQEQNSNTFKEKKKNNKGSKETRQNSSKHTLPIEGNSRKKEKNPKRTRSSEGNISQYKVGKD